MSSISTLANGIPPGLGQHILKFTATLDTLNDPNEVLERLEAVTMHYCHLRVLGAALLPLQWGSWTEDEKGKTVFISKSVPKGWWPDYAELNRKDYDPGVIMARLGIAPYTWSEGSQLLAPIGADRWSLELGLKYGMRDGLTCPIGGRWVVVFWSRKVLSLSLQTRALLFMAAAFVAIRLQAIVAPQPTRIGKGAALTQRELAVLRLLSLGKQLSEIAKHLALGEETVRSHLKKAQAKLGVHSRTHAVAQAIRRQLIP